MVDKQKPIGVCDHCEGPIPRGEWYTSKGTPRLHCSFECKQTANSRKGNPTRVSKLVKRVAAGLWKNPRDGLDSETIKQLQSTASRKGRLREVAEGRWRNPALTDEARKKLSRPRKHSDVLHSAIEKLRTMKMDELTIEERDAYHAYRSELRNARRDEINRLARERYHRRQSELSPEQRKKQRKKWRRQNKTKTQKKIHSPSTR